MDLGWCDVCLRVENAEKSKEFYDLLGFAMVEGELDKGWCVVTNGDVRLGLYEPKHMGENRFTLNFRGGPVMQNAAELQHAGVEFGYGPQIEKDGSAGASFRDPDGHTIYLNTFPGEVKPTL